MNPTTTHYIEVPVCEVCDRKLTRARNPRPFPDVVHHFRFRVNPFCGVCTARMDGEERPRNFVMYTVPVRDWGTRIPAGTQFFPAGEPIRREPVNR
jgi:hypothetical protein